MFKWLKDWGNEVKDKFQVVVPGYFGGDWATNGLLTNPGPGDILADTEALPAGIYDISLIVTSTASSFHTSSVLQHRNAANDATLKYAYYPTHAQINVSLSFLGYKILEGERLRLVSEVLWVATVQGSIWYVRRFPLKRGQ